MLDTRPMSRALESPPSAMSAGWSAESLARGGWTPTPNGTVPAKVGGSGAAPTISATWLSKPEPRPDMEQEQGPGLKDVKMVTFELPDLKSVSGR